MISSTNSNSGANWDYILKHNSNIPESQIMIDLFVPIFPLM